VGWIDTELALVAAAAMLSPTTLSFSILVLVLSERPLRSGLWFYVGALAATLGIGIVAAFVLRDAAASSDPSTPKTWVAIVDLIAGVLLLLWAGRALRRPRDPKRAASMLEQMQRGAG
jgi:Sap, sulfolipid-1-addressing protein